MVGAEGFEPPTSCTQNRRATKLRYAPTGVDANDTEMVGRDATENLRRYWVCGGFDGQIPSEIPLGGGLELFEECLQVIQPPPHDFSR